MAAMDSTGLDKSGWVCKKAQVMPSWNERFLVAEPRNLRLKYYKERPKSLDDKERGELKLTNCTASIEPTDKANEYRFLITSADHRKTFHLQVDDPYEMSEWIRIVRLISDLGVTKTRLMDEEKLPDNFNTFKKSCTTLLERLEQQATASRESLDKIAKQKWKSKNRLIELRDDMEEKHRKLRQKQQEMKQQEKSFREELSHLNQQLYILQQQVRRSNELQQKVVEIFGNNQNQNITIIDKAIKAIQLCQQRIKTNEQKKYKTKNDDEKNDSNLINNDDKTKRKRGRSNSDITVSKSDIFEHSMVDIIQQAFPDIISDKKNNGNNSETINGLEEQNKNVIKIFELYHRYYVEIHLPREMELRKIRTKCEQKYNSLRYVSNKKDLARREEDEIDWVMMEMKRAIDRLNREGVGNSPDKNDKNDKNNNDNKKKKKIQEVKKPVQHANEHEHYQPPQNQHRDSSTMVPVLAHRSTWSEASDTIFQLNVARQQQYQATKDLEESLKSREMVKSWYEEKIAED